MPRDQESLWARQGSAYSCPSLGPLLATLTPYLPPRLERKAMSCHPPGVRRALQGTYGYSQDRCLHGGPSVLPSVYDQDESNASILQTETGRNTCSQHVLAANLASVYIGDPTIPCHLCTASQSACQREVSAEEQASEGPSSPTL